MRKNKSSFNSFFMHNTPLFIVLYLFIFSSVYTLFNRHFALKNHEKVQIFSITYGVKDNYGSALSSALKEDGVLDVMLYNYDKDERNLYNYFITMGGKSDLHIISGQTLAELQDVISDYYLPLTHEVLQAINAPTINNYEQYYFEENAYGFALFKDGDDNYNNQFNYAEAYNFQNTNTSDDYYLLINKKSVNIAPFNAESLTSNALKALNWLMEHFSHE